MSQNNGTASGRDENGRFVKGNKCGRGNPFARQTAQLRKAFVNQLNAGDMSAICATLIMKAKQGDVAAARLVLAYGIGRPTEAENPDRLDVQEWEIWRESVIDLEDFTGFSHAAPLSFVNPVAPFVEEANRRTFVEGYHQKWRKDHPEEYEQYMQNQATEQEGEPSTNGSDGGREETAGPSANGDNGTSRKAKRPSRNGGTGANPSGSIGQRGHNGGGSTGHKAAATPSTNGETGQVRPRGQDAGGPRDGQAESVNRRREEC